jgi:hypothetical protein
MSTAITGVVHGNTITLAEAVPPLEGRRVHVVLEPADTADLVLSEEEQDRLCREWVDHGPQGPLDNEAAWPDEV